MCVCVCVNVCVCVCVNMCVPTTYILTHSQTLLSPDSAPVDGWMRKEERMRGGSPPLLTVLWVLHLSDAAVRRGPLIVVLRQGQGPDARPGRRLGAGRLRLLQPAVIVAVLGGVLGVLYGVGGGEGHATMRVLEAERNAG